MFLLALASMGHSVPSDFEEKMVELCMVTTIINTLLRFVGIISAIVVGVKNTRYRKRIQG